LNDQVQTKPANTRRLGPLLKFAVELGPLLVFFFVNARVDIFAATAAYMVAAIIALAVTWFLARRVPIMPLVTGIFVLAFGGLTLFLQNDLFIKMKPTIVNALFGAILLGGLFFGRSLLKPVLGETLALRDEGWRILTLRWGLFFFALAVINEFIWRNFSTEFWVDFKVFGIMPLTMIFAMSQFSVINRYMIQDKEPSAE